METKQKNRGSAPAEQPRKKPPQQAARRPGQSSGATATAERPRSAPAASGKTGSAQRQKQSAAKQKDPRTKRPQNRRTAANEEPTDLSSGKKRAYGNSRPKQKSRIAKMADSAQQTVRKQSEQRKARREANEEKRRRQSAPAVIYTEPKAFNRRRFAMQLLIMAAVVAAFVMGISVFFKVETITVSGAEVYDPWSIREAAGIKEGDSLLTFSRPRAGAQIKAKLPYVKSVRFGIKLPDTVNIIIEEEDVVYAVKDTTGAWWLVSSEGRVVAQAGGRATSYTQILGVILENPSPNTLAVAQEAVPISTGEEGDVTLPPTTTGARRLEVALQIVSALEANDIVGAAASVDVTHLEDMILWYGTRYQVNLGDATDPVHSIEYKIACMNDVILQLSEYQSGILDISFTIWPDQVGYTPFG